jgi:hypothetical protein
MKLSFRVWLRNGYNKRLEYLSMPIFPAPLLGLPPESAAEMDNCRGIAAPSQCHFELRNPRSMQTATALTDKFILC